MANPFWIGGAAKVAEVTTLTPGGTITTGDVDTLTVTNEAGVTIATPSFTVGGTTTAAAVVTGLIAAWNGNAACAALATASGSTTLILTAIAAGKPFYVAPSVTGVGTLTGSNGNTTKNAGPNDWNTAANWSTAAVPAAGDNVLIDGRGGYDILTGLYQAGIALTSLSITTAMAYQVGTTVFPLNIGFATGTINQVPADGSRPQGSPNINLVNATGSATVNIFTGRNVGTGGQPAIQYNANSSSNNVAVQGGNVGIGTLTPGQSGTLGTVTCSSGSLAIGSGVTTTNINNNGGNVTFAGANTTLNHASGTTTMLPGASSTTVTAEAGTIYLQAAAASTPIGTLNLNGGIVDSTRGAKNFTITTVNQNADYNGKMDVVLAPKTSYSLATT